MLTLTAIEQYYGESHTLWNLNLEVPAGACLCLMGRNGVGKTTLLKVIMGLIPVRSGTLHFGGRDLTGLKAEQRAGLAIGYVPQGREIFPLLTVEENLKTGLRARGGREIPTVVYEIFPVLKKMLKRRGGDLSGGQQQQLAIARALVLEPKLLILDEPTEGIQPNIVSEIGDVILRLNQELGVTVLLVEQKLPFARRVASQFCLMDRGRAVATGIMSELSEDLIREYLAV